MLYVCLEDANHESFFGVGVNLITASFRRPRNSISSVDMALSSCQVCSELPQLSRAERFGVVGVLVVSRCRLNLSVQLGALASASSRALR